MSDNKAPFKHCDITVVETDTGYEATYDPPIVGVDARHTTISFKLKSAPHGVIIGSVTPDPNDQLSTPSISADGKHVTLNDINSQKVKIHLDFGFINSKGEKVIVAGPSNKVMSGLYPDIDNNPP
ncbi:hypothetical protein [Pseudoduganella sp. RAF53_2]|uniref:hypothetical protein n=1 Tax=unclassified Pseudoduganella TaxID=2637179 RepID=UPI003F963181